MSAVDTLLTAPTGVALLAGLEAGASPGRTWMFDVPVGHHSPDAIDAAVDRVASMSMGDLLAVAVNAAYVVDGAWTGGHEVLLTDAYRRAELRRPIAEAMAARFDDRTTDGLAAPFDRTRQEWWTGAVDDPSDLPPRFGRLDRVYCCGEFTFQGIWTVTDPPPEVHDGLTTVWEVDDLPPVRRWRLPVDPTARIHEIHDADDWIDLVARHPAFPAGDHWGWELPGPNQHPTDVADLETASAGRACRSRCRVAMPDWRSVADEYDGVHLSWRGFLAAEGHVVDVPALGDDVVTLLRYWFSERTLWLRDVFGVPEPLPAPMSPWPESAAQNADADAHADTDLPVIARLLGR